MRHLGGADDEHADVHGARLRVQRLVVRM